MNWYKTAQYENLSQLELSKMIKELIPQFRELWDKEWNKTISPEEKITLKQIGDKMDYMGNLRTQKIEQQREFSEQSIKEDRAHEVLPRNFIDYHNTGTITEDAYDIYKTKKGVSWLGVPNKYPILIKKEIYGEELIEFRKKDEKLILFLLYFLLLNLLNLHQIVLF